MELKNYFKFYFKSYYISYINVFIKNIKFPVKNYIVIFNFFIDLLMNENFISHYIYYFLMFYKNSKKKL